MELSNRLMKVASLVEYCNCVADIGTDHAYLPIYLVKNNICCHAIASDINKGPVKKAMLNVSSYNLQNKIECRLGSGLNTLKPKEADIAIIAGMGGNLIRDIIEERIDIFKELKFAILQPVQNPEVLREYLYNKGYEIIEEELCIDENIFYEIIKIRYGARKYILDEIFYEVSKDLYDKKHPLIKEFIINKLNNYNKIISKINDDSTAAAIRKNQVAEKIGKLEELIKCL
ncbi:MAG: tRNA (adenine(22)-N(1))-methyltransferase [Solirubrobacterales bacterium]